MASFDTFWEAGHKITKHNVHGSRVMGYRTFRAFFGTSPQICVIVWNMLSQKPANSSPEHLLWALMVLKLYNLESVNASLVDVTEKTFRKWSLIFIRLLAGLQVLDWDKRYENAHPGTSLLVSLDGTDFRILEPTVFDPKWYSHKFRGPGLRYEVGLCIRTGNIVWAHGGFPCGKWSDIKLARELFVDRLDPGEKALADKGYLDDNFFVNPNGDEKKKNILARHETVNRRIKQFSCMERRFRHALFLHPPFFHAVVNLTQLMIENGEPLYPVEP